jgi:hypothetical protein
MGRMGNREVERREQWEESYLKSYIVQGVVRSLAPNRSYLKRFGRESIGVVGENVHIKSCEEKEARNFGLMTILTTKTNNHRRSIK